MKTRLFKGLRLFSTIAIPNVVLLGLAYREDQKNKAIYSAMTETQKEQMHNACSEQKVGKDLSIYSAFGHRMLTDSGALKNVPPREPYKSKKSPG